MVTAVRVCPACQSNGHSVNIGDNGVCPGCSIRWEIGPLNQSIAVERVVKPPWYTDEHGYRYHDEEMTHRILSQAGPGGTVTWCTVDGCRWPAS